MFSKKKYVLIGLVLCVLFAFKQADEYFEISKNLEIFGSVYKTVHKEYVDDVNPGDVMKKGIDAMLASLDPYTNFYTESQAEDAMIRQSGEYGGIGCRSRKIGDYISIISVFQGLPADKAGLRIGDKIIEINGKSFVGKTDEDASEALKGSPGTKANITVDRQGKSIQLELLREEIKINNVTYSGLINNETGYIRLDHFTNGAAAEVKDALLKLKSQGIKQVILDLRDNGGGLLHEAVNIVNIFVGMNESVVISKGRSSEAYREYKTLNPAIDANIPLMVLVNENSASASEIVCGAIQDLDRGIVVGRNTFGKGLVQNVKPLVYGTQMKVTIAKYYIPSGRCIQLLDYGHKTADGKASIVADSLRKKFKTRNGRTVFDGGGVKPDLLVEAEKTSNIARGLERSYLLYDFANKYRSMHESIGDMNSFKVDDALFNEFKTFVSGKSFSYLNESENAFKALKEKLEKENFTATTRSELNALEAAMLKAKNAEMEVYKEEIKKMLYTEICRRYFYEDAVFTSSFKFDKDIEQALGLFANTATFNQLIGKK